jgi:hypothetical protein
MDYHLIYSIPDNTMPFYFSHIPFKCNESVKGRSNQFKISETLHLFTEFAALTLSGGLTFKFQAEINHQQMELIIRQSKSPKK